MAIISTIKEAFVSRRVQHAVEQATDVCFRDVVAIAAITIVTIIIAL